MNKQELVSVVAAEVKLTKKQSGEALDAIIGAIVSAVGKGEDVVLIGFGTFKRSVRKERKGRNPQTGAELTVPAAKVPKFTPGKAFKDAVK
jgi:DNA-binding protein HU-beta